jgi:hypothetical protein
MNRVDKLGMINPLVADPPKVVELAYMWGELSLTMGHPVNPSLVSTFKNMGKFSYPPGYHLARFSIKLNNCVG